ncbi:uncharacterized protein LOC126378156 isoform X3 [Pectinophora gossypiella]|uniref:uncharacterized protein LOC126378156 isoform X3 n=1 Tax=Pectinophora gossypiella TaxID=13191 RepID=UPI00214E9D46|nr:uncharacterized protein LOC126378156 isoform X3 [Pectinophora gossypiella]
MRGIALNDLYSLFNIIYLDSVERRPKRMISDTRLTAKLHSLAHRRKIASMSVFYRLDFRECARDLHELIPPSPFYLRTSRRTAGFHPYMVDTPTIRTKSFASSLCALLGSGILCQLLYFRMHITWVLSRPGAFWASSFHLRPRHCLRAGLRPRANPSTVIPETDLERKIMESFEVFDHSGKQNVDVREVGTILRSLVFQLVL